MKLVGEHNEKRYEFEIPFTAEEITFAQYLDFIQKDQDYLGATEDQFMHMIAAISRVATGDWQSIPVHVPGDEKLPKGFTLSLSDDLSVTRVYVHICSIITEFTPSEKYTPKEIRVTYKDEEYSIPASRVGVFLGKDLTAGEYIEFMELERMLEEGKKKIPENRGDLLGNMEFRMNLRQMAVLLRKDGEELPVDKKQRDTFIDKRAEHFQELPLSTVLNVRRFFLRNMIDYIKRLRTDSFSKAKRRKARGRTMMSGKKPKRYGS